MYHPEAHWSSIKHVKTNVGSQLNKALEAIEEANIDVLQDVLSGINFNRKIGQRTLDDDTLANFVQNFEKIPLRDEDFEFPDLLGAAYEYLIKQFADSAGKKAGEFYTPAEVVRVCVEIVDPREHMSVYDPTIGSGGMLIQARGLCARLRRQPLRPGPVRPGKDRFHLVHLQNEHAPARHRPCRYPPGRHHSRAFAQGRDQRTQALRPGTGQSAFQPELHQE